MKVLRPLVCIFGMMILSAAAQAGPITSVTLDDCDADGCEGSDLFLSVEEESGGTWLVTYKIDASGYTGNRTGINQAGFKAVSGWSAAELIYADPGLANWADPVESPVTSNGNCNNTKGNTDKVCTEGYVDITGGGEYTWQFRLTGGTLLDTSDWHLGGQYANASPPGAVPGPAPTAKGKIISASPPGQAVPEPSAAILFGVGLFVLRRARRVS